MWRGSVSALNGPGPPRANLKMGGLSVSVLIPSVKGGATLTELVERLGDSEVLIADNGLPADSIQALRARNAAVVPMGGNVGFSRAINRLARLSQAEAIVVLNDDIVPEPGFIERLTAPLDQGAAAMVAGVLLKAEDPTTIDTAGIVLDAVLSSYDYLQGQPRDEALRAPPPLGPSGGAAAYDRAVFDEVGGFDEGFFAYCEDVDLAIRIHGAGGTCALAPGAQAVHIGSGTLGWHSLEKAILVGQSRGYLWRKYGIARRPSSLLCLLSTELVTSAILFRRHRSMLPARARLAGFRKCATRCALPESVQFSVSFREGVRRRYARSLRPTLVSAPRARDRWVNRFVKHAK